MKIQFQALNIILKKSIANNHFLVFKWLIHTLRNASANKQLCLIVPIINTKRLYLPANTCSVNQFFEYKSHRHPTFKKYEIFIVNNIETNSENIVLLQLMINIFTDTLTVQIDIHDFENNLVNIVNSRFSLKTSASNIILNILKPCGVLEHPNQHRPNLRSNKFSDSYSRIEPLTLF